jgi:hypothetical protein
MARKPYRPKGKTKKSKQKKTSNKPPEPAITAIQARYLQKLETVDAETQANYEPLFSQLLSLALLFVITSHILFDGDWVALVNLLANHFSGQTEIPNIETQACINNNDAHYFESLQQDIATAARPFLDHFEQWLEKEALQCINHKPSNNIILCRSGLPSTQQQIFAQTCDLAKAINAFGTDEMANGEIRIIENNTIATLSIPKHLTAHYLEAGEKLLTLWEAESTRLTNLTGANLNTYFSRYLSGLKRRYIARATHRVSNIPTINIQNYQTKLWHAVIQDTHYLFQHNALHPPNFDPTKPIAIDMNALRNYPFYTLEHMHAIYMKCQLISKLLYELGEKPNLTYNKPAADTVYSTLKNFVRINFVFAYTALTCSIAARSSRYYTNRLRKQRIKPTDYSQTLALRYVEIHKNLLKRLHASLHRDLNTHTIHLVLCIGNLAGLGTIVTDITCSVENLCLIASLILASKQLSNRTFNYCKSKATIRSFQCKLSALDPSKDQHDIAAEGDSLKRGPALKPQTAASSK